MLPLGLGAGLSCEASAVWARRLSPGQNLIADNPRGGLSQAPGARWASGPLSGSERKIRGSPLLAGCPHRLGLVPRRVSRSQIPSVGHRAFSLLHVRRDYTHMTLARDTAP